MNLEEARKLVPWSQAELARQSGLDHATVSKAEKGKSISSKSASMLLSALSHGLGRTVTLKDVDLVVNK